MAGSGVLEPKTLHYMVKCGPIQKRVKVLCLASDLAAPDGLCLFIYLFYKLLYLKITYYTVAHNTFVQRPLSPTM